MLHPVTLCEVFLHFLLRMLFLARSNCFTKTAFEPIRKGATFFIPLKTFVISYGFALMSDENIIYARVFNLSDHGINLI